MKIGVFGEKLKMRRDAKADLLVGSLSSQCLWRSGPLDHPV
jgi:hypothetical protein